MKRKKENNKGTITKQRCRERDKINSFYKIFQANISSLTCLLCLWSPVMSVSTYHWTHLTPEVGLNPAVWQTAEYLRVNQTYSRNNRRIFDWNALDKQESESQLVLLDHKLSSHGSRGSGTYERHIHISWPPEGASGLVRHSFALETRKRRFRCWRVSS